ncbi:patatin-like phospholipase family protein [Xanthomonas campestris pv. mirabilis]|uniref:patatin-like phospholipase family protein n=1 Tax=Xanthomonas euvesicatoria TaxID=456327 RepID=UPI0009B8F9D8|nr:patatin-like phospholipase family protein [Xanthomonas euvesicatoria]MBV6852314.1 patatin-like phospholipase family protein [Xanthomonas campestris pv. mirabilis]
MSVTQKIYVSFQGGGAKGVAHVGGLRALEEWISAVSKSGGIPHEISAVAGTSAGAIIAALVAAGYRADDIFGCEIDKVTKKRTGRHLLDVVCEGRYKTATALFTEDGWSKIKKAKELLAFLKNNSAWVRFISINLYIDILASLVACLSLGFAFSSWVSVLLLVIPAVVALGLVRKVRSLQKGLASLTVVREVINDAIYSAVKDHLQDEGRWVTFADLKRCSCKTLKIVSTNVSTRDVEVFSYWTTPNVNVADAVCASICLPVIFAPYEIEIEGRGLQRFVDGGVLSNLPLWPFDEDRALSPEAWTVGFSLVRRSKKGSTSAGTWLSGMIEAILSGPSSIHKRGIPGLMMIPVPTGLDLLDFDLPISEYVKEVEQAKQACAAELMASVSESLVIDLMTSLRLGIVENLNERNDKARFVEDHDLLFTIALRRPEHPSLLWPRFTLGFFGEELVDRLSPFERHAISAGDPPPYPSFEDGSSGEQGWLALGSKWLVALELELPSTVSPSPGSGCPVLLIESQTLTLDQVGYSMVANDLTDQDKVADLVKVLEELVGKFPQLDDMLQAAMRTQLWK